MTKKLQPPAVETQPEQNNPEQNDIVHIDFDFDFKFYASPQAKHLLQWLSQALKWLIPFFVAFSTLRPVEVAQPQSSQDSPTPPITAQQSPQTTR
jgi:hypothetical protein